MKIPDVPLRELPPLSDHLGLDLGATRSANDYVEQKLRRVWQYQSLFAKATRNAFDSRVYIDLLAGPGVYELKSDGKIIPGSPLLATSVEYPFDRFIFCEKDPESLEALKKRLALIAPTAHARAVYLEGDVNERVEDVIAAIPRHSTDHKVISLCFVDPEKVGQIPFRTIQALTGPNRKTRAMDILFNIPTGDDIRRNFKKNYLTEGNDLLDDFLGGPGWRDRVSDRILYVEKTIPPFVCMELGRSMVELEYEPIEERDLSPVTLLKGGRGPRLYHLTVFGRDPLALKLWRGALAWSEAQTDLRI